VKSQPFLQIFSEMLENDPFTEFSDYKSLVEELIGKRLSFDNMILELIFAIAADPKITESGNELCCDTVIGAYHAEKDSALIITSEVVAFGFEDAHSLVLFELTLSSVPILLIDHVFKVCCIFFCFTSVQFPH
jgi:hypothetical protein